MNILDDLNTLKENYAKLEQEYATAKALADSVTALQADKETLAVSLAEKEKAHTDAVTALTALTAERNEVQAALDNFKAERKTAEQLAIDLVAKQGIAPIKVDSAANQVPTTPNELRAHYAALLKTNPKEAGAFYNKHRAELLK